MSKIIESKYYFRFLITFKILIYKFNIKLFFISKIDLYINEIVNNYFM